MADYLLYHTTRTSLGRDIVSLVDRYTAKEIQRSEEHTSELQSPYNI